MCRTFAPCIHGLCELALFAQQSVQPVQNRLAVEACCLQRPEYAFRLQIQG
ncbi:hypothetical protein D3C76_1671090 [compost metagenome]